MKTIDPVELQRRIDKCDVELIDVRPAKDFKKVHALAAHSIPWSSFEPHTVIAHRKLDRRSPLYIMAREKAVASLAACSLASTGLATPVVVEGGIEGWAGHCLPTVCRRPWHLPRTNIRRRQRSSVLQSAFTSFITAPFCRRGSPASPSLRFHTRLNRRIADIGKSMVPGHGGNYQSAPNENHGI